MSEWISVDDRLPNNSRDDYILCYRPTATFDRVRLMKFFNDEFDGLYAVTHWMPLPPPPNINKS